jgi:RimJ/RimL family protein N-acetyltransferase
MNTMENRIDIRRARLSDIGELTNLYMLLPSSVRIFFHPFPFDSNKIKIIFTVMVLGATLPSIIKKMIPKLAFGLVIAKDKQTSELIGFVFYSITRKENNLTIANAGPIVKESAKGKGVATQMYNFLMKDAKTAGVDKFRVTILEDNIGSIIFHKKLGYVNKGYASDEVWEGRHFKNLSLELDLLE